ncbi:hypothetical protein FZEAL_9497 [Fusarium zealandicum]|uniref:Uncharacterized protein n=1 Tax=Fusarium zealandicum TaxID=1053134 RepID=A0A8H4UBH0_9HYPO|nr:hypothetical protein FZEAL_9497 [Fusarium zealandicum]
MGFGPSSNFLTERTCGASAAGLDNSIVKMPSPEDLTAAPRGSATAVRHDDGEDNDDGTFRFQHSKVDTSVAITGSE